MSTRRERAVLEISDNFSGRMAAAAAAAGELHRRWELYAATWEPHDWSDF